MEIMSHVKISRHLEKKNQGQSGPFSSEQRTECNMSTLKFKDRSMPEFSCWAKMA